MTKHLFLGIDISTTGAKALLMDSTGEVVTTATTALPLSTPKPLWSEQEPRDWWHGIVKGLPDPIVKDSFIEVWDAPGMGVEFDIEAARQYLPKEDADFFD